MEYQVVVLSEDTVFGRMLELEFAHRGLTVQVSPTLAEGDRADVLILDLDSALAPPAEKSRKMVGFSRRPAISAKDARSCSMILRRPFRMSLLRREVLLPADATPPPEPEKPLPVVFPRRREVILTEKGRRLTCEGKTAVLSKQEFRIMRLLLQKRGQVVTREELLEVIGPGSDNRVEVYICYLRRKTDRFPAGRLIRTVHKKGYRVE